MAIRQLGTIEHDTAYNRGNSIVMIDDTHFVLAYEGDASDGFIKTFYLDGAYNPVQIDVLEHDTVNGQYNSLIRLDDTHYVLAYTGSGTDGFVKTFEIDADYQITQLYSLEHDTSSALDNSLVKIDDTHFMLAYAGPGSDGFIKTFSVNAAYEITQIDSVEHDDTKGVFNTLSQLDATHYVLAYQGKLDFSYIKTFEINDDYEISEIWSYNDGAHTGWSQSICAIDPTHFILVYTGAIVGAGPYYVGMIKTFSIIEEGEIIEVDSLEHDSANGTYSTMAQIDDYNYVLAYSGTSNAGVVKNITIDGAYTITELGSFVFDNSTCFDLSISLVVGSRVIVAYAGADDDGFISTFSLGRNATRSSWRPYDNTVAYVVGDRVTYLGSYYVCIADSTGNLPTDTLYWIFIKSLSVKVLEKQSGTLTKTAHAWLGGLITSETTGYTGVQCSIAHITAGRWTLTGTSSTVCAMDYATGEACVEGHQIYITSRMVVRSAGVDNIYLYVTGTTGGSNLEADVQATPVVDTSYTMSGIVTLTAAETGNIKLRWYMADADGVTGQVLRVYEWTAIDLTEQFGAGSEPSAAELDAFFAWRWELMTKKNYKLYNSEGYGDSLYFASKIADHGLEYNDMVSTSGGTSPVYHYFSPVYVLNDDWIITGWYEAGFGYTSWYRTATSYLYWTKTDYTDRVQLKSLQMNMRDDLDGYARMKFLADIEWQPLLGMTVIISDGTETLLTGHIVSNNRTNINATSWLCDVEVHNLIAALQWNISTADDYWIDLVTSPTSGSILEYLLMEMAGPAYGAYTGGQGIWFGNIETGNTAASTRDAQYKTVYELVNSLCLNAGLSLKITGDRRIKCESALSTPQDAPFNLTDAVMPRVWNASYNEDISEYGESVVIRGGYKADGAPLVRWINVATKPLTNEIFGAHANKNIVVSDQNAANSTDAATAANAILNKQGIIIPGTLTFTTDDTAFRPGQKITVDVDRLGLSSRSMHVDDVLIYDVDGQNLLTNVTCSHRDTTSFSVQPNKASGTYMSELSNKVTQSVSALTQGAGSFTPTLYGSTTAGTWAYTTQEGYYNIHANQCYINIRLNPSSIADAVGNLMIGGLPFAASTASTLYNLPAMATGLAWGASMTQLQLSITDADDFGTMYGAANNAAWVAVGIADISTGDEIRISGVYLV